MDKSAIPYLAFTVSGTSALVAVPASSGLQAPDLPGVVLVLTGTAATMLARHHLRERVFTVLAALVVLMAALLGVHVLLHFLEVEHDWLELPYLGAFVAYCVLSLSRGLRLLRR